PVKNFAFCPGQVRQAVAVMPHAAKVLKRVKFIPQGIQQQVPAKRQNRAPETQQMMGAENIRYRRKHERIFF
ncbi:hypothetical protein PUM14_RS20030, partial [Escherichia coli]